MHLPRRARRVSIAWTAATVTAVAALLSTSLTAAASAAPTKTPSTAKVDAALQKAVEDGSSADFFIVLKGQADLSAADNKVTHGAKARSVYGALRSEAAQTQQSVTDYLDAQKVGHEDFWLANAVLVHGDEALVDQLAERSDVAELVKEKHYALDDTERTSETNQTDSALADTANPEWGIKDIKADQVWDQYGDHGEGIVIANVDSGVQFNHPDLVNSYRGNNGDGTFTHDYNWYDPTGQCGGPTPCDNNGHGTHTMGTMVGANGVGVAPGAKWIAAKGCESRSCSDSSLLAAGQWILAPTDENGKNPRPELAPNIVNNSWGGGNTTFYQDTIEAWNAAGIFEAFAAGNSGNGTSCSTTEAPGAQAPAYGVGAYDVNGKIANFSGFGPSRVDGSMKPNISGPGVDVRSTWPGSSYNTISGTSMATPHVAGAVALLWSAAPSLIGDIDATRALLNQGAVNVNDTHCGGTADFNNVWGEGKLDILASVEAAPHAAATVSGTVTDQATGAPIANATVTVTGADVDRTLKTGSDGSYRVHLIPGTYEFTVRGYGYHDVTRTGIEATDKEQLTEDFALQATASYAVSGRVLDVTGKPLANSTVSIQGTPLDAVTSDASGRFSFPKVAQGDYTLSVVPAEPVLCNGNYADALHVSADITGDRQVPARTDGSGHSCAPAAYSWISGKTKVALSGDEDAETVALPFKVNYYGVDYTSASVTTNGLVNFIEPRLGDYDNTAIPSGAQPNGIVAPYWDDLTLDNKSKVQTATVGKVGARQFAISWEKVLVADSTTRLSFEVVFDEATGAITFQYLDVPNGSKATIGIEDQTGTDALQYSFNQAVLADGSAIRFTQGATGAQSGSSTKQEPMVLTSKQADPLAEHVNIDVYGAATTAGSSDGGARESDAAADPKAATSDSGASTQAATTPVTFTQKSTVEGAQGLGATISAGANGAYYTIHSLGNVQLHAADGSTTWARTKRSFLKDWGITSWRPWETELYTPAVMMGYSAVSPSAPYSDQGYDTADVTGDGVPDIVFSTSVGFAPPGWSNKVGTFVTILDGKTGATLWSQFYNYASKVKFVDGTLLIADSPALNSRASNPGNAKLTGTRFTYADGKLSPASTWTYDTGAKTPAWGALESIGGGQVAAVWDQGKTATSPAAGHTVLLKVADGSVTWRTDSALYGRQLHFDSSRNRIVALEQADPTDGVKYQLAAYSPADGTRTTLATRINALPTAMTIGDAADGGGADYIVSESTFDANLWVNSSTIRVLDGTDPHQVRWTYTTKRDANNGKNAPSFWDLDAVGGSLVASAQSDRDLDKIDNIGGSQYGILTAFTGNGGVKWKHDGVDASPMMQELVHSSGGDAVRVIDQQQNIRTYNVGNGKQKAITPLFADMAYAQALDVDGDGHKDVVAGGQSSGVWAFSGTSLMDGTPRTLWQVTVPGQVHRIETGDVNGDGKPEVVVAADTATVVLSAATGKTLATIDGGGQYVRSVTVADVNGDGKDEILVPTDALRVYRGDGKPMWSYSAPAAEGDVVFSDTVVGDGQVYTQYSSVNALQIEDAKENGVALDGKSGKVNWKANPTAPPESEDGTLSGAMLDDGVFTSPHIPYADGHAVVYTWLMYSRPQPGAVATPAVEVEIRDGRTGEVLTRHREGSPWSHGDYFVDSDNDWLYSLSFGVFYGAGANGGESYSSVAAPLRTAEIIDGPGGRQLVVGGTESGLAAYDKSLLSSGQIFASSVGSVNLYGARNYLAADLDGDGVDEMLSLNYDDYGLARTSELLGGGAFDLDQGIHQMSTYKLS